MKAIIFAALAGLCWGVGELFSKSVLHSKQVGPMGLLVVRTGLAFIPALIAFFVATRVISPSAEPPAFWKADAAVLAKLILGATLLAGFGGVFFFYLGLAHGDISRVKPIAFGVAPAVAAILGMTLMGEQYSHAKAVGIALIIGGIIVVTTQHAPARTGASAADQQTTGAGT